MNNVYFYDQELSGRRHQKFLEQLETRLTDLGISGKICRLGPMTRIEEMVRQELAKKPKTIIVVGSDSLATRVASVMSGSLIPLAVIPVGKSLIAEAFGVNTENACKTLAARRIVRLDLGRVDNAYSFVCRALIQAIDPVISLDGELSVSAEGRVIIEIVNIVGDQYGYRGARPDPNDGKLNVYILKTENGLMRKEVSQSAFVCRQVHIVRGVTSLRLDDALEINGAKDITISSQGLEAIVGRERLF